MAPLYTQWIPLALASGACAAFNGVFAKLTTTELTTSIAASVGRAFGSKDGSKVVEYGVRGIFFVLNLAFNGVMWALFTAALAKAPSTTRVSILNTSANFMLTALLGWIIFTERLPPLWWLGAAFLVAGNVIIGRRGEGESEDGDSGAKTGAIRLGDEATDGNEDPARPSQSHEEGTSLLAGDEAAEDAVELDEDVIEHSRSSADRRDEE